MKRGSGFRKKLKGFSLPIAIVLVVALALLFIFHKGITGFFVYSVSSDNGKDKVVPFVELELPMDEQPLSQKDFALVCSSSDNVQLRNVTLYNNLLGDWRADQTKQVSGKNNLSTFDINSNDGTFIWNCLACDSSNNCAFAESNYSFSVGTGLSIGPFIGNTNNVITNLEDLSVDINESLDALETVGSAVGVEFRNNNKPLIKLNHDFSKKKFDFTKIKIRNNNIGNRSSVIISGLNDSKSVYIDLIGNRSKDNSLCAKDAEINDISEISSSCNGTDEIYIKSVPFISGRYSANYTNSSNLSVVVSGLMHSGVIQMCTENWQCSNWSSCSNGVQTRNCNDLNACGSTNSIPGTSQTCSNPGESEGAGGGSGGGGSSSGGNSPAPAKTGKTTKQTEGWVDNSAPETNNQQTSPIVDNSNADNNMASTSTSSSGSYNYSYIAVISLIVLIIIIVVAIYFVRKKEEDNFKPKEDKIEIAIKANEIKPASNPVQTPIKQPEKKIESQDIINQIQIQLYEGEIFLNADNIPKARECYEKVKKLYGSSEIKNDELYNKIMEFYKKLSEKIEGKK